MGWRILCSGDQVKFLIPKVLRKQREDDIKNICVYIYVYIYGSECVATR